MEGEEPKGESKMEEAKDESCNLWTCFESLRDVQPWFMIEEINEKVIDQEERDEQGMGAQEGVIR